MKKIISTSIFILYASFLFAQTSKLKGRVLDSNGFPLPGATIQLDPSGKAVVTDFDGFFTILDTSGEQKLKISYLGFNPYEETLTIDDGETKIQNFTLSPMLDELNEVVISVFQDGIIKGLNKQKSDLNVTNVISADQIGKFPDDNLGDVLKRVAGVSMQGDQGEARNIVMRGLGPGLNSVTLNGERIPSAEGDNRNIQLDLIPSAMIQTIEVNKTLTPDMEADAIGGSVNLITRSNPTGFRASLTAAGGGQPIRSGGYNSNFSLVLADKLSEKFSYTLSGTLQTKDYGSDNIEFVWTDPQDWATNGPIEEMDIRRYDVKRTRRSISLNFDYNFNANNKLFFRSIYNHRDDWENRYRLRVGSVDIDGNTARIRKQTKGGINNKDNDSRRLEDQRTQKFTLGGEHQIERLGIDWKISTSKASEDRPNERYVRYEQKNVPFSTIDITNPRLPMFNWVGNQWNDPSEYDYKKTEEAFQLTEEKNNAVSVDFDLPYNTNDQIKFGFKYKDKTKMRDNVWYEFDNNLPTMDLVSNFDATINNYSPGSQYQSGIFMSADALGNISLNGPSDPNFDSYVMDEFAAANYDAKEKITAFYAMIKDKLSDKLTLIAGARLENTKMDYKGYEFDVETMSTPNDLRTVTGGTNYTNILPNLTLQWDLNDKLNVNVAMTQSLARPAYYDLVPYESSNSVDQELSIGNPELKASLSTNIDAMVEYYFNGVGLLSAGYFNKNINDWIYKYSTNDFTYNGTPGYQMQQLRNGEKATVNGFEITFQTKFLKNFTFMGNYTNTSSSTDRVEGRNDVPLVGQVDNMYNLSLAFETGKFFIRGSYNYADASLDELSDKAFEDRYYDKQSFLDINANYRINNKLSVFAEGKNLTNQPLRYYQGIQSRTMQLEYYNISWNVGLKYDF